MKSPDSVPPGTLASRLNQRLFQTRPAAAAEAAATSRDVISAPRRALGFPASIAEFLLVLRLRVRRRSTLSAEMLERAVRMVVVTCQNWFSPGTAPKSGPGKRS